MPDKFVEVKYHEPVGEPVTLFYLEAEQIFDYDSLKKLLETAEQELDRVCFTRLQTDEFFVVFYNLIIAKSDFADSYLGEYLSGGFDLTVQEGRKHALPEFQRFYKKSFRTALKEIYGQSYRLNIDFNVSGFRDTITQTTLAVRPE